MVRVAFFYQQLVAASRDDCPRHFLNDQRAEPLSPPLEMTSLIVKSQTKLRNSYVEHPAYQFRNRRKALHVGSSPREAVAAGGQHSSSFLVDEGSRG
jgi:hypothetical protein